MRSYKNISRYYVSIIYLFVTPYGLWAWNMIEITKVLQEANVLRPLRHLATWVQPRVWKACIKIVGLFYLTNLVVRKNYTESRDIRLEVFHDPATYKWECVRGLEILLSS